MRNNCRAIKPEIEHSIDEQIIPAKTKYSGIRQHSPKKPVKWAFKNIFRSESSGIMYDVFIYQCGKTGGEKCTGSYAVSKLIETLLQHTNYKLFIDNWFYSLALCLELRQMGFLTIATIRFDRIKSCTQLCEQDLKKRRREAHAYRTDLNSGISFLRWYINTCVQMGFNYSDPAPTSTIKR